MKRKNKITISLSDLEKNKLDEISKLCKLTKSSFIRQRIMSYIPANSDSKIIYDVYSKLCYLTNDKPNKQSIIEIINFIDKNYMLPKKQSNYDIIKEMEKMKNGNNENMAN